MTVFAGCLLCLRASDCGPNQKASDKHPVGSFDHLVGAGEQ
jgi:hypothetical protein